MTREEIIRLANEQNVEFIRMQFTDIFGTLKNVALPVSQLEKALDNKVMFDGSSIEGFVRIEESDMYLYPDYDTFCILPWRSHAHVARMICDVRTPEGEPFVGDPRSLLKRVLAEAAAMGYTFNLGPECEFFLFHLDEDGKPTTLTHDEASYFDMAPLDGGEDARRDMCLTLEKMGFEIEASHHEVSQAQHEIDFRFSDALTAADSVMTFKLVVKTIARAHGLHATFMPKPIFGINGSGMHLNMSLFKDGKNAFYDPNDEIELSEVAYQFIAGILAHVKGAALITNPLVNSYKRLVPGFEAPVYTAWSTSNRSVLVRIPNTRGNGTRVELRNPDPTANPYLAAAVLLSAGLDGIRRKLSPPPAQPANIFHMTPEERTAAGISSLPGSLEEAIRDYKADTYIRQTLGAHVDERYLTAKEKEWAEYRTQVHAWELDRYLTIL